MSKNVMARDVAVEELKGFLKQHLKKEFRRGTMTDEKIEEDYPDVLDALEDGFLVFENGSPKYKLREPLKDKDTQEVAVSEINNFKTRIKGADKTTLLNGIDPKKQLGDYMIIIISHISNLNKELVKKLEKEDFDVLNQICSVF